MKTHEPAASLRGIGDDLSAIRVYKTFGMLPLRIEVLRFAMSRREFSAADVMAEFRLTRNGAVQHLKRLADARLLTSRRCTHPRGSGPITYWTVDNEEVRAMLADLYEHLMSAAR